MTLAQRKEVLKDTSYNALFLLEFYYSKAGAKDYKYEDQQAARALDWTTRKVRDNRLLLEKKDYFKKITTTATKVVHQHVVLGHKSWGEKEKEC